MLLILTADMESVMRKRSKWVARGAQHHGTGPVANHAVVGRGRNRKMAAHLDGRRRDYDLMLDTKNSQASGVQQRKESGGFHKPGSNQR